MKQTALLFATLCVFCGISYSQETIQKYKGKTYIFDSYEQGYECNALGTNASSTPTTLLKGSLFTVVRVPDENHLVIKFLTWNKKNPEKREKYNFTLNTATNQSETKFFLIEKNTFDHSSSEYNVQQKWDINFGTLTTPFKFRHDPFFFTTNLNLGTSVSYQRKFYKNWSWGIIAGLSLSQVVLDSFSTNAKVKTNTERPAVTPSLNGMLGYKNINVTLGIGWDFINKTSEIEKSWIYHGNRWIGIGIGVSLFNSNNNSQGTTPEKGQ